MPLNVGKWVPPFQIQSGIMSNSAPAVWAHESQLSRLSLQRQSLSAQITTFRHILRALLRRLSDPFQVVVGPFLVSLGVRNVLLGVLVRPCGSLNGKAGEKIRLMVASNSVAGIMRTQFSVNVNPVVSDAQLLHPGSVWSASRRAHRQAHKSWCFWIVRVASCINPKPYGAYGSGVGAK